MAGHSERIIIPSPLKKRDFILHEGEEYQIIKFLRTEMLLPGQAGFIYNARNTRTNEVVNVPLPFDVQRDEEGEEDNYFQILELHEDRKEVTLKSWLTGIERKMKVRWDENVEVIRDGLMEEDKDLFCTLLMVMGKEVIGDFKLIIKEHPILKMPDLVLDNIFSKLTPEDRLRCRLVTPRWKTLLPINKFLRCISLAIDHDPDILGFSPIVAEFHFFDRWGMRTRREEANMMVGMRKMHPNVDYTTNNYPFRFLSDLRPLTKASLLEDVKTLKITERGGSGGNDLQVVSQYCHKLTKFIFYDLVYYYSNWEWGRRIILANKGRLQHLEVTASLSFRELDLSDIKIEGSTSLQHLNITLSRKRSIILNLEYLPPSITSLSIECLAKPLTKGQVLFIHNQLPQLTTLTLEVYHNHSDSEDGGNMDEDEIDHETILQMMTTPSLHSLTLSLGPTLDRTTVGGYVECCEKVGQMNYRLHQYLNGALQSSVFYRTSDSPVEGEVLVVKKEE